MPKINIKPAITSLNLQPILPTLPINLNNAGIDVVANSIKFEKDYIIYTLGFCSSFDKNTAALVMARSSLCNMNLLVCNHIGLIDSNYRNEWQMRFKYFDSNNKLKYKKLKKIYKEYENDTDTIKAIFKMYKIYNIGDRIGQMVFVDLSKDREEINIVDELDATERTGGFGSTGLR